MRFTWDETKAAQNLRKHGVSFEEASSVFDDPRHLSWVDGRYDGEEQRWLTLGHSTSRVLIVAHVFREEAEHEEEIIRIISARRASPSERKQFYERLAQIGE